MSLSNRKLQQERDSRQRGQNATSLAVDPNAYNAYNDSMATLNIRNLPDDVHRSLRIRAAQAGRSMEAEAREIITAAVRPRSSASPETLQEFVRELYQGEMPEGVVEDFLLERRREAAKD